MTNEAEVSSSAPAAPATRERKPPLVGARVGGTLGNKLQPMAAGGGDGNFNSQTINDTGIQTLHYERNFRHYLVYGADAYQGWKKTTGGKKHPTVTSFHKDKQLFQNHDWSVLPYQFLPCYMSPRQYQALNIMYRRWRIKRVRVVVDKIINFVDDIRTQGGSTTPSIEVSPLNYFECFIDKHQDLPEYTLMVNHLPNDLLYMPFGPRSKCTLHRMPLEIYTPMAVTMGMASQFLQLEQSPGYTTIPIEQGFSYTHEMHEVDTQWRHAFAPVNSDYYWLENEITDHDGYQTSILGVNNAKSGMLYKRTTADDNRPVFPAQLPVDNCLYDSLQPHMPRHPLPAILLRVPEVMKISDVPVSYGFVLHVRYEMEIEAELAHTMPLVAMAPVMEKDAAFLVGHSKEQVTPVSGHRMMMQGSQYFMPTDCCASN